MTSERIAASIFAGISILCYHATTMARACEITGKSTQIGGRYSNRTRATQYNPTGKVRRKANLHKAPRISSPNSARPSSSTSR
jgi:hypothetical protein